jgi:ComF family protein
LFPKICVVCDNELNDYEKFCCSICLSEISFTNYENAEEPTDLDKLFWGRINIFSTYSLLFYNKYNNTRSLLKTLKYKNRPDIAVELGKIIGKKLLINKSFKTVDVLIPVPIHQKKKHLRGYNQSEKIADGIISECNIKIDTNFIRKIKHNKSQTNFGKFKRWDNVEGLYLVNKNIKNYNHIAVVDDVITTGSTIETIIQSIQNLYPNIKISVISLAFAK